MNTLKFNTHLYHNHKHSNIFKYTANLPIMNMQCLRYCSSHFSLQIATKILSSPLLMVFNK